MQSIAKNMGSFSGARTVSRPASSPVGQLCVQLYQRRCHTVFAYCNDMAAPTESQEQVRSSRNILGGHSVCNEPITPQKYCRRPMTDLESP